MIFLNKSLVASFKINDKIFSLKKIVLFLVCSVIFFPSCFQLAWSYKMWPILFLFPQSAMGLLFPHINICTIFLQPALGFCTWNGFQVYFKCHMSLFWIYASLSSTHDAQPLAACYLERFSFGGHWSSCQLSVPGKAVFYDGHWSSWQLSVPPIW